MSDDIVSRLRDYDRHCSDADIDEAADEIVRLRNQVEQLQSEVADAKKWAMSERGLRYEAMVAADEARRPTGSE